MSSPRRSSEPDIELQEIAGSKAQRSKDRKVPLLQEAQPEHPRRPRPRNYGFFRRYLYGRNLMLYLCLGILVVCLVILVVYFAVFSDETTANYKVTKTNIASNQNLYSVLLEWNGGTSQDELPYITENRVPNLNVSILCYTATHFRFIITDQDQTRWQIPETDPYSHVTNPTSCNLNDTDVSFSIQDEPFSIRIWRTSTQEILFDMNNIPLVFAENYIEITTQLASLDFYGLGERLYKFQMGNGTYTIWPYDQPGDIENGHSGHNLYGQQPMYLLRESTGDYHVVLLRNSNAMDIQINSEDKTMRYQVVGGVLDFNIFLGSTDPETVIEAYHDYVGNWMVPPFWSMGFHQSKWGYNNISDFRNVLQNFEDYKIPLDAIWSDIDYMINYIGFTIDTTRYPIDELKVTLEEFDKRWVPIMDAGIGVVNNSANIAYTIGLERDVFLKENDGDVLLGTVWPGTSAFPDFLHPNTSTYWADMLESMYTKVPFDGVWLDMNEISNFCDTQECLDKVPSQYLDLPVIPGIRRLDNKTLPLDAVHYGGALEFNVHSLFNLLESKVTYDYLKTKSPLPFILTRANIFGSGKYASHWFGDTRADWISMRYTIASMFNYNLFGIPHVGADICGFQYATTPELCTRWTQLGAFYPFARNHHELFTTRQEPFHFDDPYRTAMIDAIRFRYSILKHFYTLFVGKNGKGTIVKPLFFEFPDDANLFNFSAIVEEQFMIGNAIMVAPVLYYQQTQVQVYFPAGTWFSLLTYEQVEGLDVSRTQTIDSPIESMIPTYIRGGYIVMVQDSSTVMSTRELTNEFSMVIAFNDKIAAGEILDVIDYEDTTIYEKCITNNCVLVLDAELAWDAESNKLVLTLQANRKTAVDPADETGYIVITNVRVLASQLVGVDVTQLGDISLTSGDGSSTSVQASKEGDSLLLTLAASIALSNGSTFVIGN